jgi:hypothetical protein
MGDYDHGYDDDAAAKAAMRVVHLMWGTRTLCGLDKAHAEAVYAPDAPRCARCGSRDNPNMPDDDGGAILDEIARDAIY